MQVGVDRVARVDRGGGQTGAGDGQRGCGQAAGEQGEGDFAVAVGGDRDRVGAQGHGGPVPQGHGGGGGAQVQRLADERHVPGVGDGEGEPVAGGLLQVPGRQLDGVVGPDSGVRVLGQRLQSAVGGDQQQLVARRQAGLAVHVGDVRLQRDRRAVQRVVVVVVGVAAGCLPQHTQRAAGQGEHVEELLGGGPLVRRFRVLPGRQRPDRGRDLHRVGGDRHVGRQLQLVPRPDGRGAARARPGGQRPQLPDPQPTAGAVDGRDHSCRLVERSERVEILDPVGARRRRRRRRRVPGTDADQRRGHGERDDGAAGPRSVRGDRPPPQVHTRRCGNGDGADLDRAVGAAGQQQLDLRVVRLHRPGLGDRRRPPRGQQGGDGAGVVGEPEQAAVDRSALGAVGAVAPQVQPPIGGVLRAGLGDRTHQQRVVVVHRDLQRTSLRARLPVHRGEREPLTALSLSLRWATYRLSLSPFLR